MNPQQRIRAGQRMLEHPTRGIGTDIGRDQLEPQLRRHVLVQACRPLDPHVGAAVGSQDAER